MPTRRGLLRGLLRATVAAAAVPAYATSVEPFRLGVKGYRPALPGWPEGRRLRIAALADLHACEPWMTPERIRGIVARTNDLRPDITVLLGDYTAGHRYTSGRVPSDDWAGALGELRAPLGVHAILGNHDWWDDRRAQKSGHGPVIAGLALAQAGIRVLENEAVRIAGPGGPFWLAGLGDQLALTPWSAGSNGRWRGKDDLPGTLAQVTDDAPVILLAHEPDIFPRVPARVALTLSGHTHGGQVRMFGWSPVVPSRHGNRYAYGHVAESRTGERTDLIVSGGLGCSIMPVRVGVPPEITLIELGRPAPTRRRQGGWRS